MECLCDDDSWWRWYQNPKWIVDGNRSISMARLLATNKDMLFIPETIKADSNNDINIGDMPKNSMKTSNVYLQDFNNQAPLSVHSWCDLKIES